MFVARLLHFPCIMVTVDANVGIFISRQSKPRLLAWVFSKTEHHVKTQEA
jgi:hypothetical protein